MPTHNKNISDGRASINGRRRLGARGLATACALCVLVTASFAQAGGVEIHSNGRGGGLWSEPETWHGRQVPGPEDTVVIAMRDRVEFDRDDRDRPSCAALYLDPEAVLSFRSGRERRTLTVAGPIESYGTIHIDGTGDRRGLYELVLAADDPSRREIRLLENAGLLSYGHEQHRRGERTARILSRPLASAAAADADDADAEADAVIDRTPARITADGDVMFDLHHTHVHDVHIELHNLDNTGATNRERLNVIGSYFTGASALRLDHTDTPAMRNNTFQTEAEVAPETALYVNNSALADIRGNVIEGPYHTAIFVTHDTDTSIRDVRISGAVRGIYVRGQNTAVAGVEIMDTERGIEFGHAEAVLEGSVVRGAKRSFYIGRSTVQFTDVSAVDPWVEESEAPEADAEADAEGDADADEAWEPPVPEIIHVDRSAVRLINSPIEPDEITHTGGTPDGRPYVETMQYLIVQVSPQGADATGEADEAGAGGAGDAQGRGGASAAVALPRGIQVRVQTAEESGGVPAGRADLNVRNSPVPVSETGLTPLPRSRRALAVRGWRIDSGGDFRQAPFYDVIIERRSEQGDGSFQTLVQEKVEPRAHWFRPEPNRPEPTIKVTLP